MKKIYYNRQQAVAYAEKWWNDYNPAYRKMEEDCTNFISQCLRAGGAPMTNIGQKDKGWWYIGSGGPQDRWSHSWAIAHSLRWHLAGDHPGLAADEVSRARDLAPGDVICYDFDGDGRWQHNTIVVTFDREGEPLVNAHTVNSQHRRWTYEDSYAWTKNVRYKFFHIRDVFWL